MFWAVSSMSLWGSGRFIEDDISLDGGGIKVEL